MADGKTFECAIITPEAKVFEGSVQFVALPAHDGGIRPGDSSFAACKERATDKLRVGILPGQG